MDDMAYMTPDTTNAKCVFSKCENAVAWRYHHETVNRADKLVCEQHAAEMVRVMPSVRKELARHDC